MNKLVLCCILLLIHQTGSKRNIANEKQLRGPKRFLSDGLASRRECKSLIAIARIFAVLGDGYKGKKSPHTERESFHGITLGRAAFLTYVGLLDTKYLEIYLRITESVRREVKNYFKLNDELHFSYTHLVCRSALSDPSLNRTDLSHQIHADNCNILEDGVCEKTAPAFFWRDYSAILYLNSNFEGGEFIFSNDLLGEDVQSSVEPKCGRMVAFSSGQENLHGVKAVKSGSRCAIGIWFTFNVTHIEKDRALSYDMLDMLKNT